MSVQLNRQSLGDIACLCVSAHTWRCWEPLYPVSGFVHIASKCCRRGGLESQEPVLGGGCVIYSPLLWDGLLWDLSTVTKWFGYLPHRTGRLPLFKSGALNLLCHSHGLFLHIYSINAGIERKGEVSSKNESLGFVATFLSWSPFTFASGIFICKIYFRGFVFSGFRPISLFPFPINCSNPLWLTLGFYFTYHK